MPPDRSPHDRTEPRRIDTRAIVAAAGGGLAAVFVLLGLAVRSGPTDLDTTIVAAIHSIATGWVRSVLDGLSVVGTPIVWDLALLGIAVGITLRGRKAHAAAIVGWLLAAEVIGELAKIAFDRARPAGVAVSDFITQASYPSGHVVRTAVALGLVALLGATSARDRVLALGVAVAVSLLMGAARVSSGEHWPTDVIGGFLLSGAVLCAAAATRRRANLS